MMNFDYQDWHPMCQKEILSNAGVLYLHCKDCQLLVMLEAVSTKTPTTDSFVVAKHGTYNRELIGQRSPGHPKGVQGNDKGNFVSNGG